MSDLLKWIFGGIGLLAYVVALILLFLKERS